MEKYFLKSWVYVGLFAFIMAACSPASEEEKPDPQKTASQKEKAIVVKTAKLETRLNSDIPVITSGILNSKTEMNLSFKIGGIIQRMLVDEGQTFGAGQLLATLDQSEIQSQVNQAQSALQKTERDLQRAQNLYADTVATLEQVQNATTAKEVAQADLKIARFNQRYSAIYARTPGRVLQRFAEEGELINPGNPVLLVASSSDAQVIRVGISDRDVIRLNYNDRAEVQFDAYGGEVFEAQVTEIAEMADMRTGTYEVELTIQARGKRLKNGFVGKVKIFPNGSEEFYQIPMGALAEGDSKTAYVFVPTKDKKARRIELKVANIGNNSFMVAKKDFPAEFKEIITDGVSYLSPNASIKIVP